MAHTFHKPEAIRYSKLLLEAQLNWAVRGKQGVDAQCSDITFVQTVVAMGPSLAGEACRGAGLALLSVMAGSFEVQPRKPSLLT